MPMPPKATGAVLAISESPAAGQRPEAELHQDRRRHGHGRAKSGRPLKESAEGKGDEDDLHTRIRR